MSVIVVCQANEAEVPTSGTKEWNDPMPAGVREYQVNINDAEVPTSGT